MTRAAEIGGLALTRVSALDLQEPLADRLVAEMGGFRRTEPGQGGPALQRDVGR